MQFVIGDVDVMNVGGPCVLRSRPMLEKVLKQKR